MSHPYQDEMASFAHEFEASLSLLAPRERLKHHLSTHSLVSTASSFAMEQQAAHSSVDSTPFVEIGRGFCGVVLTRAGTTLVYKRALTEDSNLWHDYSVYTLLNSAFNIADPLFAGTLPRIPRCYEYVTAADKFWVEHGHEMPEAWSVPAGVLVLERVLPLPRPIRHALIHIYCPESGWKEAEKSRGNKDCIVRIYLGRRRPSPHRPTRFFSLRNFPMYLDQAEDLGIGILGFATEMANGLAVCHWRARVDAHDVEWVLGSAPTSGHFERPLTFQEIQALPSQTNTTPRARYHNFKKRTTHLWMLDFDQCKHIAWTEEMLKRAAESAEENDPYYPKPCCSSVADQALWTHFASTYLAASDLILNTDSHTDRIKDLPKVFIDEWVRLRQLKTQD